MQSMITSPDSASGTTEHVVEKHFPEAAHDRSGIELFEREVIPVLS